MVNLFEKPHLSSCEVAVCAKHEVLMDADDNIVPSIGDTEGILDHPLSPQQIYILNIIIKN